MPKGPSTDPSEKRLALRTEDHPLDFADFEGVIPEGERGAGPVIVWDAGTYRKLGRNDEGDERPVSEQLDDGHLTLWLDGEKLAGGYALTRMEGGDREEWLLVKMDDDEADARRNPTGTEPESVKTGRTLEEVREEGPGEGDDARSRPTR